MTVNTQYDSPTIEQIFKHGSVRSYLNDPVSKEMVEAIVSAAQRSATSNNFQVYSVIATTDKAARMKLSEVAGGQEHIKQAPVFLTWVADLSRLDRVCQRRGYKQRSETMEPFLVASVDAAIAMQTATLAAESLGLGACYIGAIRNDPAKVIELLGLPKLTFPISGMTLGWPVASPNQRPRLALDAVLHWERYDVSGEEQHMEDYDQAMINTGIYHGRQVPVPGVEDEMEEYGWQEHCARQVSQPQRERLRSVMAEQGFQLK